MHDHGLMDGLMDKELLLIIPAHNEEEALPIVLEKMRTEGVFEYADILVINDASDDDTVRVRESFPVHMITNIFNLGYALSIQLGYKYAVKNGYSYVIQIDADGQHDTGNIRHIYECLISKDEEGNSPDRVIGSRFLPDSISYEIGSGRMFCINLYRRMIRRFTGLLIMDPTSGLQGLSRNAFEYYSEFMHFDDRYPDANMVLQMILLGYRITEIPATMKQRVAGESMHSGMRPIHYMHRVIMSCITIYVRHGILKRAD